MAFLSLKTASWRERSDKGTKISSPSRIKKVFRTCSWKRSTPCSYSPQNQDLQDPSGRHFAASLHAHTTYDNNYIHSRAVYISYIYNSLRIKHTVSFSRNGCRRSTLQSITLPCLHIYQDYLIRRCSILYLYTYFLFTWWPRVLVLSSLIMCQSLKGSVASYALHVSIVSVHFMRSLCTSCVILHFMYSLCTSCVHWALPVFILHFLCSLCTYCVHCAHVCSPLQKGHYCTLLQINSYVCSLWSWTEVSGEVGGCHFNTL